MRSPRAFVASVARRVVVRLERPLHSYLEAAQQAERIYAYDATATLLRRAIREWGRARIEEEVRCSEYLSEIDRLLEPREPYDPDTIPF